MVEALYNASGLGLPIVMTVANRAIGAPINIWNDHCDAMSQRDSGWIQLYAETNQEAARPAHPGLPARRGAVAAGDGLHGRLHPHPRLRAGRRPRRQEQVDAFLPPFEPRQVLDPADPVTIGAMVGPEAFTEVRYLAHAKQMQALDLIPEIAAEFAAAFGRDSGGLRARLPHRGRRDDRRRARLGARHDRGHRRRAARARACRSARSASSRFRPFPLRRGARGARRTPSGWSCSRRRSRSASAASSRPNVRMALSGLQLHGYTVIAGLGGRPITKDVAATAVRRRDRRPARAADLPRPGLGARRARARADASRRAGPARTPRTCCATSASSPPDRTEEHRAQCPYQQIKFYQTGTFAVGNRLLDPEQRSVQADAERSNSLTSGHRACQGCGEALGRPLRARRGHARDRRPADRRQRDRLPRGLLHAVSRSPPGSCRGSTRCSATPRRSPPGWPPR